MASIKTITGGATHSDGVLLGSATSEKVGFFGTTPADQPVGSAQAAVTTTVGSAVAGTAATNSTPYGYSQAQADAIVTNINALRVDVLATVALVNKLRTDLVELGIIKGAA